MARKQSKLLTIYDNIVLRDKVGTALDNEVDYQSIADMCKKYGIEVSVASISRYAKKRQEAIKNDQDLRELLDADTERTIINIKKKQVDKPQEPEQPEPQEPEFVKNDEVSVETMLNNMIQSSYRYYMQADEPVPVKEFTKMIKLYTQINGNNNHGLTQEGLQQLRIFRHAQNNAMVHVILKYVPEDKRKEVLQEIKDVEEKEYKKLDVSEQGKALLKFLDIGNDNKED